MRIQVNQPVTINGNTFGPGQHTVPTESIDQEHWFFKTLVKEGKVIVISATEEPVEAVAVDEDEVSIDDVIEMLHETRDMVKGYVDEIAGLRKVIGEVRQEVELLKAAKAPAAAPVKAPADAPAPKPAAEPASDKATSKKGG